jgi:enoyl-CoA hydratase/carnithine racemase
MPDDILIYERRDRVAWLTKNRPEACNALNRRAAVEGAVAE